MFPVACGRTWQPVISLLGDAPAIYSRAVGVWKMESATSSAATAASVPKIIKFGFKDYSTQQKKRFAVCNVCSAKISDTSSTTSNFIRHFRLHKEK